jgi:benzylsuccinate CoA-transferase BbsF subunit
MAEAEKGVFDGLMITAFGGAVVGPLTMKFFADHGATVIRIESIKRPCTLRTGGPYKEGKPGINRAGYFNFYNGNILSFALNMSSPKAIDVAKKLVSKSDVVMENFTPAVMPGWGLGYEDLKKVKPDIIMLRQSGFGSEGPYAQTAAFGMVLAAIAGLPNFVGWPDGGPLPLGVSAYTDCISPRFASAALIAALDHRNKTGKGQLLDLSQFETAMYFILPAILDYAVNGREPARNGNAVAYAAPHGVFPCKGEDRWCTIDVESDEQWSNLCNVIGKPEHITDARFSTLLNRKQNENEVNRIVGEWTANFTSEEAMVKLQAAGIPAGMVKNTSDVYGDPQLRSRNIFWSMEHSEMGTFTHLGQSFQLSETPAKPRSPAPALGEHTEYVCTKILGMTDDEFVGLIGEGVLE